MSTWTTEPADIMQALGELHLYQDHDRSLQDLRSAAILRAAETYRPADDDLTVSFDDHEAFAAAAVEHVLDLVRDVPMAETVRLAIANELEVGSEEVGCAPKRKS